MGKGGTIVPDLIPEKHKKHTLWSIGGLAAVVIGLGCLAAGAQVHIVREFLTMFSGDELSIAVVFSCWLAGVSAGSATAGKTIHVASRPWNWFAITAIAASLIFPLLIILLRFTGEIGYHSTTGQLPSAGALLLTGLCFITPIAFFMGFTFPLACKVASEKDTKMLSVGRVYVLESIGAIAGGLLVSVVLPGFTSTLASLTILSIGLVGGLSLSTLGRQKFISRTSAVATALLLLLVATGIMSKIDDISTGWRFERMGTGARRIAWSDTPYQHLDLSSSGGQYNLFEQGKVTASFPDPYIARPRAHMVLLQHSNPRDVLRLGPTFGEFALAALYHPIRRLDMVQLDPGVINLVSQFLPAENKRALGDAKLHLHITDGRRFLNQSNEKWDLIFSDSPDPTTASLNRFYTREFFSIVRAHLKKGGVFGTRISSVVNLQGMDTGDRLRTIQLTMSSVFKNVLVIPGQETFLFASDSNHQLLDDPSSMEERMALNHVSDPHFFPQQLQMLVQPDLIHDLSKRLQAMGTKALNTDNRPVTYLQSIVAWSNMTKDPTGNIIKTMIKLPWWFWFVFSSSILSLAGLSISLRFSRAPEKQLLLASSISIAVVGATGMALELVLSYAYQSLVGSLYQELGLIVAAFMAGLVAAGTITQKILKKRRATAMAFTLALWSFALLSLLLPYALSSQILRRLPLHLAQAWILLLVFLTGAFTGTSFPLAARLVLRFSPKPGPIGGRLDAWDHAGASISVLFTGLIMIPLLGRAQTCFLLAIWCFMAGGIILIAFMRPRTANLQ